MVVGRMSLSGCALVRDPRLLAAFREGRRDALTRVYRAHVRAIDRRLRWLAANGGRTALAQACAIADLRQEVFVRAFSQRARHAYDGRREFGPYLDRIAYNCFVDAVRAAARETLEPPCELARYLEAPAPEPEPWTDSDATGVVGEYIRGLPDPLKHVYEQRFVLSRSERAASAALGVSRRYLRTRERRLRTGLRKLLARAGIEPAGAAS